MSAREPELNPVDDNFENRLRSIPLAVALNRDEIMFAAGAQSARPVAVGWWKMAAASGWAATLVLAGLFWQLPERNSPPQMVQAPATRPPESAQPQAVDSIPTEPVRGAPSPRVAEQLPTLPASPRDVSRPYAGVFNTPELAALARRHGLREFDLARVDPVGITAPQSEPVTIGTLRQRLQNAQPSAATDSWLF